MMGIYRDLIKFFLLLQFLPLCAFAADEHRKISILTCSPGEEVYELFGHTAIRVADEQKGIDVVFNYGLFSFDEPNFIWRFVLGETDYLLGATDYDSFATSYMMRGSGVTEQLLDVDSLQKNRIIDALVQNVKPENRKYRYNFLFNNCTTKARDLLFNEIAASGNLVYDKPSVGDSLTFRQIVHRYTVGYPWYSFGMDLLLGAPADDIAGRSGAQFAPIIFMQELRGAKVVNDTLSKGLLLGENQLFLPQPKIFERNNLTPFNVALLLLLFTFVVMLCERRSKKSYLVWDVLLMSLQGIAGLVLTFMVLFSQHPTVGENWLLIWLNPLPLLLLPLLIYKVKKRRSPGILWLQVAMVALFMLLTPFLPQSFPTALYPCAVALIVRSLFHIYKEKICALD